MRVLETFDDQDYAATKSFLYVEKFKRHASGNLIKKMSRAIALQTDDMVVVFDIDDTLVRSNSKPLKGIVDLYMKLHAMGAKIHLITAREESASMEKETAIELEKIGIMKAHYIKLHLSPAHYRTDMQKVGEWKYFTRQSIATKHKAPVFLTVGDQWTDMFKVDEEEMFLLDQAYPQPFLFGFVEDHISLMFLKLENIH